MNATTGFEEAARTLALSDWTPYDLDHYSSASQVVMVAAGRGNFAGLYALFGFDETTLERTTVTVSPF
jgi:hypothetical protein